MANLMVFAVDNRRNSTLKLISLLCQNTPSITADHVGDLTNCVADLVIYFLECLADQTSLTWPGDFPREAKHSDPA